MLTHVYQILRDRAAHSPSSIALGGQSGLAWRTVTSQQLLELAEAVARQLSERGIREGDRVVVWLPNSWRTPVYLFALWKLGAVVVPFDHEMNSESAERILSSVNARGVIAGYDERPVWANGAEVIDWWEPRSDASADHTDSEWSPPCEELATISFTSGTTGQPKGCMISHTNLCAQVLAAFNVIPLDSSCRLASILPLSHLFELTCGLLYPLAAGATIHYIPSRRGPEILRVLAEQHITHMMVVPQLLELMGRQIDAQLQASLPAPAYRAQAAIAERLALTWRRRAYWMVHRKLGGKLRMVASGGAALPPETHRLWERLGVRVIQGYGSSECSPMIACGRADGTTPIGSVGQAIPGVTVKVSADGELLVRGPNIMRGYWRDPERTAEVLRDGWYATGDLATIDAAGNIFLAGRARDLIVLPSGMKVWPQDVEDVLRSQPGVKDAAVVATKSPTGGAALHAYLIPTDAAARSTDLVGLAARCNGRLAQHQRLASVSWWPEADFPRTSILKVRRHLLPTPDRVAVVNIESVLAADDPVGQAIAGVAHVASIQATQTLGELGLDSLGLVDLALALEDKTQKSVADGDLRLEMTVEQVRVLMTGPRSDSAVAALAASADSEVGEQVPEWPYTWGRALRFLSLPFDLLYRIAVTRTVVLGSERLCGLSPVVVVAGTHHSFADVPLVRYGLARTPARRFAGRLLVAAGAGGPGWRSLWGRYGMLAFGLYPLRRERDRELSLRRLVRLAQRGNAILIFPQGTHARPSEERENDSRVHFRPGVAHLAAALSCPVIPFGVAGTERLMPAFLEDFHGRVIAGVPVSFKRGPLAIAFGDPLVVDSDEDPAEFAARLEATCYRLTRAAERALASGSD
jgi:long-chain acyl-CoA synthetase